MPDKRKKRPVTGKVDPRELIARLGQQSQRLLERELVAPLLRGGRIRTRVDGLVYEFRVRERFQGWGRFRPGSEHEASLIEEALPWERGTYLEVFPVLRMLLLWPDSSGAPPGTWLALPYNESDARQRFGLPMEPLRVYLCDPTAGAERFERITVRVDGRALWFEGPDLLADPQHAEWLRAATAQPASRQPFLSGLASSERHAFLLWNIHQLEGQLPATLQHPPLRRDEQRDWLKAQVRQQDLQERLRYELAKADATLHSYSEVPAADGSISQLVVEWSEHGQLHRYRSVLDPQLTVVSSGICLSGEDNKFDLTSLVNVMTTSPDWAADDY
ncbi:hypothetical protein KDA_38930 [Dictyobacter alpinus]|uniref:Uncharacterized protein n=1 Tax=Dictyobacter alpinus TaxID=2014873 RepID=A0A402BAP9_9CHLR|nr:hypothetical protein [Dictyobacter alpinus]GCE28409.1 hypothetical protein KDA_38930 [Dictyobacter alpinus]